jgi:hypothetical protein
MSAQEPVRSGYKQTEVGVIPEDWKVYALADLGEGSKPAIKAGPFGSSLTKSAMSSLVTKSMVKNKS